MKVLLLFPPITVNKESIKKCKIPMGMGYIASYLEKNNHEVRCIDCSLEGYDTERKHNGLITFGLSDNRVKERIKEMKPELIGISCSFSSQFHNAIRLSKLCKEVYPNVPIATGGVHATFKAEEILKNINTLDFIARGEGEEAFLELANRKPLKEIDGLVYRKGKEIVFNKERELIKDLDKKGLLIRS